LNEKTTDDDIKDSKDMVVDSDGPTTGGKEVGHKEVVELDPSSGKPKSKKSSSSNRKKKCCQFWCCSRKPLTAYGFEGNYLKGI